MLKFVEGERKLLRGRQVSAAIVIGLIGVCGLPREARGEPPIVALTFAPNPQTLVAGSQAGVSILQWPSLREQDDVIPPFANVHDLAFSPDGKRLAVAGGDPADAGIVQILSWPELTVQQTLRGHQDSVMSVVWLTETQLASAGLDQRIMLWDVPGGVAERILHGHSRGITALAYVPQGQFLVSGGIDQSLRVWELETGKLRHSLTIHTQPIEGLASCPSATGLPMVASCSDDRTVRFWQPTIGRLVRFIRLPAKPLCICWLNNGARIAAGCDDGSVYIIDPQTVRIISRQSIAKSGWIYALAASPQGEQLVAGGSGDLSAPSPVDLP